MRISRTCNNACHFCSDVANLDGAPIELTEIQAAIDAVAAEGRASVILSGGEPTLSKHLLSAIRYAKSKGLYVILTTNARIIQHDKIGQMLAQAGLDEIRISLHAARRTTHETLVNAEKAWVETNAAMKIMGRTSVRVVMNTVLMKPNASEVSYLMHLAMMGGMKELNLRWLRPEGRALQDASLAELPISPSDAYKAVTEVWYNAKEDNVRLRVDGFEHTMDDGLFVAQPAKQIDEAAVRMLRQRVQLHHAFGGFTTLDDEGLAKEFNQASEYAGGMSELGHEVAARMAPILDLPPCVGGRGTAAPGAWGDDAFFTPACAPCPLRAGCAGVPRKLTRGATNQLAPLPWWTGVGVGARVVVVPGEDVLFAAKTGPDLVAALRAEGADAELWTEGVDLDGAAMVLCSDAAALARIEAAGPAPAGQRRVVFDRDLGLGLHGATAEIRAFAPGRVELWREAGVPLRRVHWRPWPAPALAFGRADAAARVLVLGQTADWELLRGALGGSGITLAQIDAVDAGPERFAAETVRAHGEVDDATFLSLLGAARMVIAPLARVGSSPEERRRLAQDLRRLHLATSAGRPVVVTRGAGHDDAVRHERTGMLVKPAHSVELGAAIRRLHSDPVLFARCADGARQLGALSSPAGIAREIVGGALPDASPRWGTPGRQYVVW